MNERQHTHTKKRGKNHLTNEYENNKQLGIQMLVLGRLSHFHIDVRSAPAAFRKHFEHNAIVQYCNSNHNHKNRVKENRKLHTL